MQHDIYSYGISLFIYKQNYHIRTKNIHIYQSHSFKTRQSVITFVPTNIARA